jgi:hypothetical protein
MPPLTEQPPHIDVPLAKRCNRREVRKRCQAVFSHRHFGVPPFRKGAADADHGFPAGDIA